MKIYKKITAIILCLILTFTAIPMAAFAVQTKTDGPYTYTINNQWATIVDVDPSVTGDVVIPEKLGFNTVTKIQKHAFKDHTDITSITIGQYIDFIQTDAFYGCVNLSRFIVDENNTYFSTDEYGVLYSKDKSRLRYFPPASTIEHYTVPENTKSILATFHNCSNLITLTIPENVEQIYTDFKECPAMTDIYYGGTERKWNTHMDEIKTTIPENINLHFREENLKDKIEYAYYDSGINIGPYLFFGFYFLIGIPFMPVALIAAFLQDIGLITIKPY